MCAEWRGDVAHADLPDGPGDDGLPLEMEPVGNEAVPGSGEEIDHGPDWTDPCGSERDTQRITCAQSPTIAATGLRCSAAPYS